MMKKIKIFYCQLKKKKSNKIQKINIYDQLFIRNLQIYIWVLNEMIFLTSFQKSILECIK